MDKKIYGEVINIVSQLQVENLVWEKNKSKLDPCLQIVSINDIQTFLENDGVSLLNVTKPAIGQILMRHPFLSNTFVDINYSQEDLFNDKINKLAEILQPLGVKALFGQAKWTQAKRREMDITGEGSIKIIDFSSEFKKSHSVAEYCKIKKEKLFPNAVLNKELYEIGIIRAQKYGLYNDSDIRSFIETRNPDLGPNVIGSDNISIELTKEVNNLMSIAFSLNYLPAFSINAKYKDTLEIINKVQMDIYVDFGKANIPDYIRTRFEQEEEKIKQEEENIL